MNNPLRSESLCQKISQNVRGRHMMNDQTPILNLLCDVVKSLINMFRFGSDAFFVGRGDGRSAFDKKGRRRYNRKHDVNKGAANLNHVFGPVRCSHIFCLSGRERNNLLEFWWPQYCTKGNWYNLTTDWTAGGHTLRTKKSRRQLKVVRDRCYIQYPGFGKLWDISRHALRPWERLFNIGAVGECYPLQTSYKVLIGNAVFKRYHLSVS